MSDPSVATDSEVLRLRSSGQGFARISRELGLEGAVYAHEAFRRAVGRLPADEQDRVRREESSRLDRLAAQVNADTTTSSEDRARRLAVIDRLRTWTLRDR
jgi:hypothetical protein